MGVKKFYFKVRLSFLMYGFAWLIRVAGFINKEFRTRLAETDFSFVMASKEGGVARYFRCSKGRLRTTTRPIPTRFGLVWRDYRSGGQAMVDMLLGKPKALYHAVAGGVLLLEGDARSIGWFMETVGRLNRVFRPRRRVRGNKG